MPMKNDVDLKKLLDSRGMRLIDLARAMDVDKSRVTRWAQKRIPAERAVDVERVTGISRHDLRPDIYPSQDAAA
jgi:DNA-binding transcriptional regulator YdaS (Cro superfamily)